MDDLPVGADFDQLRRLDDAPHVGTGNLVVFSRNRDDPAVVRAVDVLAGHADVHVRDVHARHSLGFLGRGLDRAHGLLAIGDHAFTQSGRGRFTDADDVETLRRARGDDGARFGCADVEPGDRRPPRRLTHDAARPSRTKARGTSETGRLGLPTGITTTYCGRSVESL